MGRPRGPLDRSLYVLDGATGTQHWKTGPTIDSTVTPALGDIDADGIPEIVALDAPTGNLVAYEHDGAQKWVSQAPWAGFSFGAIGMADLDNSGDVEIYAGNMIFDHTGALVTTLPDSAGLAGWGSATVAARDVAARRQPPHGLVHPFILPSFVLRMAARLGRTARPDVAVDVSPRGNSLRAACATVVRAASNTRSSHGSTSRGERYRASLR